MRSRAAILTLLAVTACVVAFARPSHAGVPKLVTFQGRLSDTLETSLNGAYSVTFSLYSAVSGGTPIWTETHSNITVTKGLFTVILGSLVTLNDAVFNNPSRYLGIKIGSDPEVSPRTRLTASGYAMRVEAVDSARGGTILSHTTIRGGLDVPGQLLAENTFAGYAISGRCDVISGAFNTGLQATARRGVWNRGVYALASDGPSGGYNSAAIYGQAQSLYGGSIWAGYFEGWANVTGTFYAGAKFFKIDDPARPADRMLVHSCVESDEYKNIYDGVVALDDQGRATVTLPEWMDDLNTDFRYQLTCVGGYAPVYVGQELSNDQFTIAGGSPGLKVSWQISGVRKDAYALAHPFDVIQDKPEGQRGRYLHPRELGESVELGIDFVSPEEAAKLSSHRGATGVSPEVQPPGDDTVP